MWHYTSGGGRLGPVSEEEIARLIADGQIRPTSYVRDEASTEWSEARQTALAKYFADRDLKQANYDEAMRQRGPRSNGLVNGIISLVVVALIGGAFWWTATGGFTRAVEGTAAERFVPVVLLSDEAVARRMQAEFEQQDVFRSMRTFERLKTLFPEEYHALILELVPLYRRNATAQESAPIAERHMADFLQRNKASMLRAAPEALSNVLTAEAALFRGLQDRNMPLCARALEGAGGDAAFGQAIMVTNRAEADGINVALFEAIKSGQTANNSYAPMTQTDWERIGLAVMHTGISPQILQQFGQNPAMLAPGDKCHVIVELFAVMAQDADVNNRARFAADMMRGI